ncbi:probable phosphoglycerate mutase [Paracoccus alcaliphilus]|uniref:Probable phosphoglycerate mutase n=1 Tax=Paracoccus alcaliphilus TaxID=34002 RepID=A0A1H8M7Y9_9RHOB|nr:histidine phosphatase family protein [Paracoccus alcaliphilus]SEO13445.1 probable phosphoglycerate mutase [Paracoccus alcaliphilus]
MAPLFYLAGARAMYPDLYLMRHGQTEWNLAGRLQGRLDSPLTDKGIAQAERQRGLVAGVDAARYASTQGRAQASARIVFDGAAFAGDDRLVEIDIGDHAGSSYAALRARMPEIFTGGRLDWYDRVPGGEGFSGLEARCRAFLDGLTGPALIVTHGITLRMLRVLALGWPMARLPHYSVEQGAVHVIRDGRSEIWR